jgi:chlorobactene glucosyltransferase
VNPELIALIAALPWVVAPIVVAIRRRDSRSLDEFSADPPSDAPLVSVIVPARNEAHGIERCLRSILGTTYPRVEVIAVDDQSTDGTADLASAIARNDPRLLVFTTAPLPRDWFGKQWACATGAAKGKGTLLCFTDADTEHGPDLLARAVNAMRARKADLFSVVGRQEMGTLWEKLVQPQVLTVLEAWYGGTETVNRARQAWRKIAAGQFLMIARAVYDETGGHEAVRHTVAEDLMLAQRFHRLGKRVVFMEALNQLSVRMYTSFRELIGGWGKNVYAGGIHALPPGRFWRITFPFGLLLSPLFNLAPLVVLLVGLSVSAHGAVLLWAIVSTAAVLLMWMVLYDEAKQPMLLGVLYPIGSAVTLYIFVSAIARGPRVKWKGRVYHAR